jgi:hypothetical protein
VSNDLPSVFFRALDKEALCRVPSKKLSVKKLFAECFIFDTRQRVSFMSVFLTIGKESLPSVLFLTLGKEFLCRCRVFYFGH